MRHIVIAIDSFKGSITSLQAGNAVKEAAKEIWNETQVVLSPIADGGEGTVDAIVFANNGEYVKINVKNPLSKSIDAVYGYIPQTKTAVIEMSAAAGLTLLDKNARNPLKTTTYGVGQMIKDAILKGCRNFIIGIGGSATNDGGVGMLTALGFSFLDKNEKPIPLGAIGLKDLAIIKTENKIKELNECSFRVACDVTNPLCGELGCSAVYAPQKGATEEMVKDMDIWLRQYAQLTKAIISTANADAPGAGAAGGMGFALSTFLNAKMMSGITLVIQETGLEAQIRQADLVITGEGCLDRQTCMGKAPVGVATLAKKYNKPVIAFCGSTTEEAALCNSHGIDAYFPIIQKPCTLETAMDSTNAYKSLKETALQVFRLLCITTSK